MMDRTTYLQELEKELGGLTDIDRQNVLAYYNEFLEDAESEGQMDANAVLGSPHTLAAQIKADIAMGDLGNGSTGHTPPSASNTTTPPIPPERTVAPPAETPPQAKSNSGLKTMWLVILAIFAIPVGIPLAIALVAVVFALLVTLVALLFALAVVAVAFLATGILACVVGFLLLFSQFSVGLFYLGAGLVTLGFCVLVAIGCWYLAKLCVKGIARLFNAIRKKLTKRDEAAR
jgi:uncharacterized membrane protein